MPVKVCTMFGCPLALEHEVAPTAPYVVESPNPMRVLDEFGVGTACGAILVVAILLDAFALFSVLKRLESG